MLRKLIFLFLSIVLAFPAVAQLTASDNGAQFYSFSVNKDNSTVQIYIFNGIESSTEFDAGNDNAIWYTFDQPTTPISTGTSKLYQPDNATGYILDVNGAKTYIWVFDYTKYLPVLSTLTTENDPHNQCDGLNLLLNATIPTMSYKTPAGSTYSLDRYFTVTYNTLEWAVDKWGTKSKTFDVKLPKSIIPVPEAPLCDTKFVLSGDEFAQKLGMNAFTVSSDLYSAVAVASHITTEAVTRNEKNEEDRPDVVTAVSGSSPLELFFKSNGNVPVPLYYKWTITKGNEQIVSRTDVDQRYTFVDAGTYKVKLVVSNDYCSFADSVTVTVSTSALEVPNVFTPDGNGQNDEFRVGYKSLLTFQCWVYNRWGRLVYYWNDPQKGWDGNINGKPASVGAYFYIIKAQGVDGQIYNKKGDINLLRLKN